MNLKPEEEAVLCGVFLGDGCLSLYKPKKYRSGGPRYTLVITMGTDDLPFLMMIKPLLERLCDGKKVRIRDRSKNNAFELRAYSKKAFSHINEEWNYPIGKKGEISIPKKFLKNDKLLKAVISGLIATDGSFCLKENKNKTAWPWITFTTSSKTLNKQVINTMKKFRIKHTSYKNDHKIKRYKTIYRTSINGHENTKGFIKKIGLINPKHKEKYNTWAG